MDVIIGAFTTGLTSLQGDVLDMIATIIPIALVIAGAVFAVRKGLSWFKSLAR
jgi:hypothetical protein